MPLSPPAARVLAQTLVRGRSYQLLESHPGVLCLRQVDPISHQVWLSGPLYADPVALSEARDLFPEHIPWAGMPVDGA